uniref:CRAL-TRIO domain-containing protein n=1 Tax=Panagrellus redivivus TaxID=6233 RepID=A0A7E4VUH0_PANRE
MTKTQSTHFGEPLSAESLKLVNEVRLRLTQPIHPNFDTDFNIYRFVLNAERQHNKTKEIIEQAAKAVNLHLRYRKCLHLDEIPDIPFAENPIFRRRFLPHGEVRRETDASGRILWYVEYATITVEGIAHALRSSAACKYQFYQFEHMLRQVNIQEEATGKLSSLRHIVDLTGYEINPFMMLFVSNGTLSYYSNLFHYENYPDLVYPIEIVNVAKWVHMPYKIVKAMMPAGFSDRFRLYDNQFMATLKDEIKMEDIPESLGGSNKEIKCIPAETLEEKDFWKPTHDNILELLEPIGISAKKQKYFKVEVGENQRKTLSWYYKTDGDINTGVFFDPLTSETKKDPKKKSHGKDHEDIDAHSKEMVYPYLKITAKLVHEFDYVDLEEPGTYFLVFCNRHSWLQRRTVDVLCQISNADGSEARRVYLDGTLSPVPEDESLMKALDLRNIRD